MFTAEETPSRQRRRRQYREYLRDASVTVPRSTSWRHRDRSITMKAYKQCQLAQTMVNYLRPPTEVSLLDSQYLKSKIGEVRTCNKLIVTKKMIWHKCLY